MRPPFTTVTVAALAMLALTGCSEASAPASAPTPAATTSARTTAGPGATLTPRPRRSPSPHPTERPDPRWRFYSADTRRHTSPWYAGRHRVMIGFGCTLAPYYDHDPRCPGQQGFHHGIDVAMPCGTVLRSAVDAVVLPPDAPGAPGPAYGVNPLRLRTGDLDVLLGHTRTLFVHPGDHVRRGQRIALASDSGAPDGCHLHLEVRRAGQGLPGAIDPAPLLALR